MAEPSILEDFDGGLSAYQGDTGSFTVHSVAIEDAHWLESTGTGVIATDQINTPRGNEYRCRIVPQSGSYQAILFNVQDAANPMADCYAVFAGPNWSDIAVQERVGGSRTNFVNADASFTPGDVDELAFLSGSDTVRAALYDVDGNKLAETPELSSTAHSGGGLGFRCSKTSGIQFDRVTQQAYDGSSGDSGTTNEAPTASDDSASVENGQTVTVNVLSNDSDADGTLDPSTVSVVTQPSNGSTTVNSDGSIDYTHNGSDTQIDSFGYTVSDDGGATSNEATVSLDVTAPPSSGDPGDEYFTGDTHQSSNYNSVQAAVNSLSARDTLVLDDTKTISSAVNLKSDIRIQGDSNTSPHIRVSQGSGSDGLRPEGVSNVLIDGVVIDGQRGSGSTNNNPGTNSLIGGRGLGKVSNLRIINCTVLESGGNGMTFHCDSSNSELQDIYVGFNTLDKPYRHGILFGTDPGGSGGPNAPSLIHDCIVEGNSVTNWFKAQAYGCFGENGGWSENVAFIGNVADHSVQRDNEGGFIFEEQTRHCLHFANSINDTTGNCFSSSKNSYRNLHANNKGTNCSSASGCMIGSFNYHVDSSEDYGPETHDNVATKNVFENNTNGLRTQFCGCENYFYDNYLTYTDRRFVKRQLINCSASDVYDVQNSSSVSKSGKGVPNDWETTTQVSYDAPSGSTGASAQWSRGSIDPNDAVSVDVSVNSSAW